MKSIVLLFVAVLALVGSTACSQASSLAPSYPKLTVTPAEFTIWTQTNPHFYVSGGDGNYNWRNDGVGDGLLIPMGGHQSEAEYRANRYDTSFSATVTSGDGQQVTVTGIVR